MVKKAKRKIATTKIYGNQENTLAKA